MKKIPLKRTLTLLLALAMLCALLPQTAPSARAEAYSGSCGAEGDNLTWEFDPDSGLLTISGSGAMADYAFSSPDAPWSSHRKLITSISLPEGLTTIGSNAFKQCSHLTDLTFAEGVTAIGSGAFSYCSRLTALTFPESMTAIGSCAFESCSGLTSVEIPAGITSIGDTPFLNCSNLTAILVSPDNPAYCCDESGALYNKDQTVLIQYLCTRQGSYVIPGGVTSIGNGAFYYCSGLTEVSIPDSVLSIGNSAFYRCSGLTSVTFPQGVTSIGSEAFASCSGLTSVAIPQSVTSVGDGAFSCCKNLISASFSGGITVLEGGMFLGCENLISVSLPETVTSIGAGAFQCCYSLSSIAIPEAVNYIGGCAFCGCRSVPSLTIPEGVTAILHHTFDGCYNMTSITLPESLTSIANNAFESCYSLTSIDIPDSVTYIGESAFMVCKSLTSVRIPAGVTTIEKNTFERCLSLTSVYIPDSVSAIKPYVFLSCTSLTSVRLPDSLKVIETGVFNYCTSLREIEIPGDVTTVGYASFLQCFSLSSITIPANVTRINKQAFARCYDLARVTILNPNCVIYDMADTLGDPETTLLIGYDDSTTETYAQTYGYSFQSLGAAPTDGFSGCCGAEGDNLTWVFDPDTGLLTIFGSGAMADYGWSGEAPWHVFCAEITAVSLPDELTSIGAPAFKDCTALTEIMIPDGVTCIGDSAFQGCTSFTTVELPESVSRVGGNAFWNCTSLRTLIIRNPDCLVLEEYSEYSYLLPSGPAAGLTYPYNNNFGPKAHVVVYGYHDPEKENSPAVEEQWEEQWEESGSEYMQVSTNTYRYAEAYANNNGYRFGNLNTFGDVPEYSYYAIPVAWAVANGITAGTGENMFSPNSPCTRAQIITFLWCEAGKPEPTCTENPFSDISESAYYYKAVLWAVENGISSGVSASNFGPNSICSRGQAVTLLWNAAGKPEPETTENPFNDVKSTDYFCKAVLWALENGITSGTSPTTFGPKDPCTRAHVVSFLYKAVG